MQPHYGRSTSRRRTRCRRLCPTQQLDARGHGSSDVGGSPGLYSDGVATDDLLDRITTDPNVCFGKPTIRGTRIWGGLILGFLADAVAVDEILTDYPELSEDDIRACLAYGARLSAGHFVDVA